MIEKENNFRTPYCEWYSSPVLLTKQKKFKYNKPTEAPDLTDGMPHPPPEGRECLLVRLGVSAD